MSTFSRNDQFFNDLLTPRSHHISTLIPPTSTTTNDAASNSTLPNTTPKLKSGVYVQGQAVSSNTSTDSLQGSDSASGVPSVSHLLDIYGYVFADSGMTLAIGSPSSGVNAFTELEAKTTYRLRGGQFATDETYNSIVGASVGYTGSDTTTPFISFLNDNTSGTIVIDGIENGSSAQLSDFISMIRSKRFLDKSGNIKEAIDISRFQFIFILHERIQSEFELTSSLLNEKLYKLVKSDRSPMVPPELIESAQSYHFYDFLDRPELISTQLATAFQSPTPTRLAEAAETFFLTNKELFEISSTPVRIQHTEAFNILYSGDTEFTKQRIFSKDDYLHFQEQLDDYFGQEEATASFSDALALKVQQHLPRPTSLFCVGPPGIGKTEIAKRLGKSVGAFVRIDGNVIQSSSDLFGSERGPGQLTQQLTKGAPAVILFDEAEKMDRHTVLSLLQMLDEGLINDQFTKETWPLRESLIVFTSNAIKDPNISTLDARSQLAELFPQEFVDRLDFIVPFRYFSDEHRERIARTLAESSSLELSAVELKQVASAQSIRQIQLDIQRIAASRASASLNQELGRFGRGR